MRVLYFSDEFWLRVLYFSDEFWLIIITEFWLIMITTVLYFLFIMYSLTPFTVL